MKNENLTAEVLPVSHITGGKVDVKAVENLMWHDGFVGSFKNASPDSLVEESGAYIYSDVFEVPKKGTTVYFFDIPGKNAAGVEYAGNTVYVFSNWKCEGDEWVLDTSKRNPFGAQQVEYEDVGSCRMFSYTTDEDNVALRICYPSPVGKEGGQAPSAVYLSNVIEPVAEKGKVVDASYVNGAGEVERYRIYLPECYGEKVCKAVFSIGGDHSAVEAIAEAKENIVEVAYDNEGNALTFIDTIVKNYKLSHALLYFVGDEKIIADSNGCFLSHTESATTLADIHTLVSAEPEYYYPILEGAVMYAMGDSYIHARELGMRNSWVNRVGNKYCMDFVNYGISGSTMSNNPTGNPMFIRIKSMGEGDADIIIIEGGRNDVSHNRLLGDMDSRDAETIVGALNVMIDYSLEKYPHALIVAVTPWYNTTSRGKETGVSNTDAAEAVVEAVAYRKDPRVVCINASDRELSGIDMNDAECRQNFAVDGGISHLNLAGMKRVQPYFERVIAEGLSALRK